MNDQVIRYIEGLDRRMRTVTGARIEWWEILLHGELSVLPSMAEKTAFFRGMNFMKNQLRESAAGKTMLVVRQ